MNILNLNDIKTTIVQYLNSNQIKNEYESYIYSTKNKKIVSASFIHTESCSGYYIKNNNNQIGYISLMRYKGNNPKGQRNFISYITEEQFLNFFYNQNTEEQFYMELQYSTEELIMINILKFLYQSINVDPKITFNQHNINDKFILLNEIL